VTKVKDKQTEQHRISNHSPNTRMNIYTNVSTTPENLVKIGPVVSEISLLQAIVKKRGKKVTAA